MAFLAPAAAAGIAAGGGAGLGGATLGASLATGALGAGASAIPGIIGGGNNPPPPVPGGSPAPQSMAQRPQTPQFNFGTISTSPGVIGDAAGIGAPSPDDPNDMLRRLLRGRF